MKLSKKLFILATSMLVTMTACKDGDDFDIEPVLEIEESELSFDKNANAVVIPVKINENDEIYPVVSAGAREWLHVEKIADSASIMVNVDENATGIERTGQIEILIRKGNLKHTIEVKQSGLLEIKLIPEKVDVNFMEHQAIEVYVEGNYTGEITEIEVKYDIVPDSDWITINAEEVINRNKIVLDVAANDDVKARKATVSGVVDGVKFELPVLQGGYFTYQLPYLNIGYDYTNNRLAYPNNILEAREFELARGSKYVSSMHNVTYVYNTVSKYFPQVIYGTDQSKFDVKRVFEEGVAPEIVNYEDEGYRQYMTEHGFDIVYQDDDSEGGATLLWNKDRMISALHLPMYSKIGFSHSRYKPHHHLKGQIFDLKTFDAMPYPFMGFGQNLSEVIKWEKERGSKPLDEGPSIWSFTPDPTKEDCLERAYVIDGQMNVSRVLVLFENIELGMFPYPEEGANNIYFLPTKEMIALLESEGYNLVIYIGENRVTFLNEEKQLTVDVSVQGFPSEDFLPRLVLTFMPYKGE